MGCVRRSSSPTASAFREFWTRRLPQHPFRGLLSVYCTLRPACSLNRLYDPFVGVLRWLALPPAVAPPATGWSDLGRAGITPAEDQRLVTAHQNLWVIEPIARGAAVVETNIGMQILPGEAGDASDDV